MFDSEQEYTFRSLQLREIKKETIKEDRILCTNFVPIASTGGVTIFSPSKSSVSFTNSPYYSHEHGLAVDIYPHLDGTTALSPVNGEIVEIFTARSPRSKYFQAIEEEKVLIIRPTENKTVAVRILHTDYSCSMGEKISVGTPIGSMVKSGFFNFWTDLHIHVEVRATNNLRRAKGSLPMTPLTQNPKLQGNISEILPKMQVVKVDKNYILLDTQGKGILTLGPLKGFGCKIGRDLAILDAGIPHYKVGSVHLEREGEALTGEKVKFWGIAIGEIEECKTGLATFRSIPLKMYINKKSIRGLSFYTWIGRRPLIKVIPFRPTIQSLCEGDEVTLQISEIS